jgi:hypothetical protein
MENIAGRIFILDRKLRRLFILYTMAVAVFIAILLICIITREYSGSFNETLGELLKFRMNLVKINEATIDMKRSVETINGVISPDYFSNSSEKQLLMGLDALKLNMRDSTITVTEIAYKDTEIGLPVAIKGPMRGYTSFVSDIGTLQSLGFPFFTIQNISIKKGEASTIKEGGEQIERQEITYEINGELRLPKSSQALQKDAGAGDSSVVKTGTQ